MKPLPSPLQSEGENKKIAMKIYRYPEKNLWGEITSRPRLDLTKLNETVSTVLNIIYVFNSFPIVYTITKGAPANKTDTMVTLLYMRAFYDQQKGPATAMSVIGFVILCIVAGVYMIMSMRGEEDL